MQLVISCVSHFLNIKEAVKKARNKCTMILLGIRWIDSLSLSISVCTPPSLRQPLAKPLPKYFPSSPFQCQPLVFVCLSLSLVMTITVF